MKRVSGLVAAVMMVAGLTAAGAQGPKPIGTPVTATATAAYMAYRVAFDKAKTIDEVLPYMASSNKAEVEATPADQRAKMFEFIKMMNDLTGVKVTKETRTPIGATLAVEAMTSDKKPTKGTVDMVKEDGMWKVGKESWSS